MNSINNIVHRKYCMCWLYYS